MTGLSIQIALFIVLIEVALWCLPREVRRASQANCFRPNGTRSAGRARVERQAYHRLRLELTSPLFLIFLLGNAVYQTIDQTLTPVPRLISGMTQSLGLMSAADVPAASVPIGVWIRVAILALIWLCVSVLIAGWRLYVARRNFAEGVRTRSSEYTQFDVTRSVSRTSTEKPSSSAQSGHNVA